MPKSAKEVSSTFTLRKDDAKYTELRTPVVMVRTEEVPHLEELLRARGPRIPWAQLLRRTFELDVLECPKCHGRLQLLGATTEPTAVQSLLRALSLDETAPVPARARAPSTLDGTDDIL